MKRIRPQLLATCGLPLVTLFLTACQPAAPTPVPLPQSAWGSIITVAQVEQADAPALAVDDNGLIAAWVGSDEQGVYQAMRTLTNQGMSDPVRLPLSIRPYDQQFAPASDGRQHYFWLDSNVKGETRLFAALLKPNLDRDRDWTMLTEESTRRYTVLPVANGGVWTISSGGLAGEPNLYAHYVDGDGRWRLSDSYQLADNADWPAILQRPDGLINLYWLQETDGAVMQAGFIDGQAVDPHLVVDGLLLNPGDHLESFSAARDSNRYYLFWNVGRADGRAETWMASAAPDATTWQPPTRLRINLPDTINADATSASLFQSGFNSGVVFTATDGRVNVSWVKPANGVFQTLPVAAQVDGQIAIIFLRDGHIAGYRPMDTGNKINLIGLPNLVVDRDLYLYLTWSQPDPAGYANLQLTSLKFGTWSWLTNSRTGN